jgi:cytochrome c553
MPGRGAERQCLARSRAIGVALLLAGLAASLPGFPADAAAGKANAQMCTVCHGPLGMGAAPDAPHLAGQPEIYVTAQLKAYRSGERKHEVMSLMTKPLTDADIANLAAWFASIQVEAKAP